jgi:hypothetical protein
MTWCEQHEVTPKQSKGISANDVPNSVHEGRPREAGVPRCHSDVMAFNACLTGGRHVGGRHVGGRHVGGGRPCGHRLHNAACCFNHQHWIVPTDATLSQNERIRRVWQKLNLHVHACAIIVSVCGYAITVSVCGYAITVSACGYAVTVRACGPDVGVRLQLATAKTGTYSLASPAFTPSCSSCTSLCVAATAAADSGASTAWASSTYDSGGSGQEEQVPHSGRGRRPP